jgi:thioredoxin-like negative regulator of GroEL
MKQNVVLLAMVAVLPAGCAGTDSADDDKFPQATAAAAVAFAEAEVALLSENPSSTKATASAQMHPRARRLLYFTATWCAACRSNESTLAALAAAGWSIGTTDRDHIQVIDVDASPAIARRYGINAVPEWVLVDDGAVTRRAVGVLDPFAVGRMFEGLKGK